MRARPVQLVLATLVVVLLGTPAYAGKPPAPSASLSLPSSVLTSSTLSGTVTVSDPKLEAGRPVRLEQQSASGWTPVASAAVSSSGTATLTTTAPSAAGTYSYRASLPATKRSSALVTATSTVTVALPSPVISSSPPPVAVIGSAYSFAFRTTDDRPGTWGSLSVALPPGLSLSGAGVLSGTPTGDSLDAPVSIRFTGTDGQVTSGSFTISVRRPQPVVSAATPPDATVGVPYSFTFATSDGRSGATWQLTAGSLPAGLSLAGDGSVSGTPTAPTAQGTNTSYLFEVTVTDPRAVVTTTKAVRRIYVWPAS